VLPNWASMKGARVNGTSATIGGKEFGEGSVEVIGDEGGNDILLTIWNDEKVTCACGIEVVLPPGTREDARLGTSGTGSVLFSISVHSLSF